MIDETIGGDEGRTDRRVSGSDPDITTPDPLARRALLEALAWAFLDNPMNVAIHGPRPGRRLRANRAGLRALVLDSREGAVTRVIRHEGTVIGGFVVVSPGGFPLAGPSLSRILGCLIHQGARAMDRWGRVTTELGRVHPVEEHWYLTVLGVVPWLHNRGFGSRLLADLDRIVAEEGARPVYLESDREASMRFYFDRGFEIRERMRLFDVPCWCLGRGFPGADGNLCDSVRE